MKERAEFLAPWAGDGSSPQSAFRCLVDDVWHQSGLEWVNLQDVTGQTATALPPAPNLAVWRVDAVEAEALDLLAADGRFLVLWREAVE